MKNILFLFVLFTSCTFAQVQDYNLRIGSGKDPDSTYCLLTATTGSNFAGRGQFKSLPQLATLLQPFLSGGGTWGSITGTLSNQTDLQTALNSKLSSEVDGSTTNEIQGIDNVLSQAEALTANRTIKASTGGPSLTIYDGATGIKVGNAAGGVRIGDFSGSDLGELFLDGAGKAYLFNGTNDLRFGINTLGSPTEVLDVTGNGLFSGTLSASNLSGTNTGDAVNIFNDPVTANGALDYQGFDFSLTNIGYCSFESGDIDFVGTGYINFGAGNSALFLDNTGYYPSTSGVINLISSNGNIEIPTLDASTGAEDEWVVRDASTGKLYKKTLTATSLTLGAAATTFALTANVMTITGNGGGNTLATITGGISGQILTLIFADANVTITDDATATANTVNLSAAFTSTANDILTLVHNGTSWREVSRSTN